MEGVATGNLFGEPVVHHNRGIVASVGRFPQVGGENQPDQGQAAVRIAACVNALAGVASPVHAVAETRVVLADLISGRIGPNDNRVVRAYALLSTDDRNRM